MQKCLYCSDPIEGEGTVVCALCLEVLNREPEDREQAIEYNRVMIGAMLAASVLGVRGRAVRDVVSTVLEAYERS